MGRPKALVYKNLHAYDKLHSQKVKMYSGVENTALYLVKETAQFYLSCEVWAYCCSKFKAKKPATLSVNIPIIQDEKTVEFLNQHCWKDWVDKEANSTEMQETLAYLSRICPDKTPVYFYELDSLISSYLHGSLIQYDESGNIKTPNEHHIDQQKYYNHKYNFHIECEAAKPHYEKYRSEKNEAKKKEHFSKYHKITRDYAFEHNNLIDIFIEIGKNSVCFPVGFSEGTADWWKEKYGKTCPYAHVGEIFFVVTNTHVFFNTTRHF